VVDTSRKFATVVVDTGAIMCCTLTCEYLQEYLNKFEMTQMLFARSSGKMIHEKKPEAKNLVTLSL
jgi:hypothetical protein